MSSDNFYFTEGNKVYMGFASDIMYDEEQAVEKARRKYRQRVIRRGNPVHVADTPEAAQEWGHNEYAEYGLWWIDGE